MKIIQIFCKEFRGGLGGGAPQKFFQIHSVQSQKNLGDENENKGVGGGILFWQPG